MENGRPKGRHKYMGGPLGPIKNPCSLKAAQYSFLPIGKKHLEGKFWELSPNYCSWMQIHKGITNWDLWFRSQSRIQVADLWWPEAAQDYVWPSFQSHNETKFIRYTFVNLHPAAIIW